MRPSSYLWCDLFAVRQWPGNASDLAFGPIVARCPVFLLVAAQSTEISKMEDTAIVAEGVKALSAETRKMLAFLRVWCLVEIQAARESMKCVVLQELCFTSPYPTL